MKLYISILSLIGLILLSNYLLIAHVDYYPSIKDLLDNPEKYHDSITEQRGKLFSGSNILKNGNEQIEIISDKELRESIRGNVYILGRFDKEGFLELQKIHYADYTELKYLVSIIGLIIFLFIFFGEWKLTKKGFENARLG